MSVLTGQESSRMLWLEDEMAGEGAQHLQKTQIYDSVPVSVLNPNNNLHFDTNSALPYEKLG